MYAAFRKHLVLVSLFVLLVLGYELAEPLAVLATMPWIKWTIVTITMFLMAWPLQTGQLTSTIARPQAALLASLLNVGLIPLLIWPFAGLAGTVIGNGMLIAAATPCTLASGSVWTRRAGGNDGVTMMVTILTNSTCFVVMPMWIYLLIGVEIEAAKLLGTVYKLFAFVVLPIGIAQLLRLHRPSANWATNNKPKLSGLALAGVLSVVFVGAIGMGNRVAGGAGDDTSFSKILFAAVVLTGVHCFVFWLGIKIAGLLKLPRPDQIAVGFGSSQKTLVIGLSIASSLGYSIIPILFYHAMQLIVDTIFADRIRSHDERAVTIPSNKQSTDG